MLSLIDSCQNRVSAKQYHTTASTGSDVNFSRLLVFEVFDSANQLLAVNLSQAHSKSIFLGEKVVLSSK